MKQSSISVARSKDESGILAGISLLKKLLVEGAKAWHLPPKTVVTICVIPFVVALIGIITALFGKEVYKWFTSEDGFAESMQVVFYGVALVLSLVFTQRQWRTGNKLFALLYLGLSFALVFLIGEELSWGQRIFGWQTSEPFAAINKQAETNLHNIYGVGDAFKWIQLLIGAYGTILPIIVLLWPAPPRLQEMSVRLVPHYTLIPYFLLLFVWRIYRNLFEAPQQYYFVIAEYNEVMEMILAMGFVLFLIFQLRTSTIGKEQENGSSVT